MRPDCHATFDGACGFDQSRAADLFVTTGGEFRDDQVSLLVVQKIPIFMRDNERIPPAALAGGIQSLPQSLAAAGIQNNNSNYVIDEDEITRMGPKWLNPWPFETATRDAENILHFRSKALLVPYSVLIPMPARFKGTHYCHLPTKQYIQALLTDAITAPDKFE